MNCSVRKIMTFCLSDALAIKGLRLQRKYEQLCKYTDNEQIKILDQLGDLYSQGKAFHRAIHCYKKEVWAALFLCCFYCVFLLVSYNNKNNNYNNSNANKNNNSDVLDRRT